MSVAALCGLPPTDSASPVAILLDKFAHPRARGLFPGCLPQGACAWLSADIRTPLQSGSYLLVTSSCFPVMAFLEGHFRLFKPALSPAVLAT